MSSRAGSVRGVSQSWLPPSSRSGTRLFYRLLRGGGIPMAEGQNERWREFAIFSRDLGSDAGGRGYHEDDLEEELERLGLGEVVDGGTWMDGSEFGIQVAVRDPQAGLRVIREVLLRRNAPGSTRIRSDDGESFSIYE
jgi:hypothetical protein